MCVYCAMITAFDRQNLKALAALITAQLAGLEATHGVKIRYGGAKFSPKNAKITIEAFIPEAGNPNSTPERSHFQSMSVLYGLKPTDIDREFISNGVTYKVYGLKRGRSAYPILAARARDGKIFKFKADVIIRLLTTTALPATNNGAL